MFELQCLRMRICARLGLASPESFAAVMSCCCPGRLAPGKPRWRRGEGLSIEEPIVSPTFTIARELEGVFADGSRAHLVHVDAYRLGGDGYAPGQDAVGRLLDELESLGLDEELEDPGEDTVILMEWGEQMAAALAPDRLEIHIERPMDRSVDGQSPMEDPTSAGVRIVSLVPLGSDWEARIAQFGKKE